MRILLFFSFLLFLLGGCRNLNSPQSLAVTVDTKAFDTTLSVSRFFGGKLRGFLWPNKDHPYLQVWLSRGNNDVFHNLKLENPCEASAHCFHCFKDVTERWKLFYGLSNAHRDKIEFTERSTRSTVQLQLPTVRAKYNFVVWRMCERTFVIPFYEVTNQGDDGGVAGYILLKPRNER